MNALLIISHGSRRQQSNDEVRFLCDRIREHTYGHFDMICAAFLELASPSITDGIKECIDKGAVAITVMPYFLAAGRHVVEDIPEILQAARKGYPDISFTVTPHIGAFVEMPRFLSEAALLFSEKP